MKRRLKIGLIKKPVKSDFYQETVVEPAEKLLKALIKAEAKEKGITPKIRNFSSDISKASAHSLAIANRFLMP